MKNISMCLIALACITAVAGCGEQAKDETGKNTLNFNDSNNNPAKDFFGDNDRNKQMEDEGPQYQTPTMDVLKGKMQKFPAKYPISRYPKAEVSIVDVRPNRPPGYSNMVLLKSMDNIPQVDHFYREKMSKEWKQVYDYHNQIYDCTKWEKGDLICEVRVAQDFSNPNGKRLIQLMYGLKAKPMKQQPLLQKNINPNPYISNNGNSNGNEGGSNKNNATPW